MIQKAGAEVRELFAGHDCEVNTPLSKIRINTINVAPSANGISHLNMAFDLCTSAAFQSRKSGQASAAMTRRGYRVLPTCSDRVLLFNSTDQLSLVEAAA